MKEYISVNRVYRMRRRDRSCNDYTIMTVTLKLQHHQSLHYKVVDRDQSYCSAEREYLGTLMPIACK